MKLTVLILLVACGSSTATRSRLLEDEELVALRRSQPALITQAEAAESSALSAREDGEEERAGDLETEARLLFDLAAATEQAERFEAEARELAASVESEASVLAEATAEREMLVNRRISRETRDNAFHESRRAFAIAEADERRRLRRRSTEVSRARLTAAAALAARVDLLSVATTALGGEVPSDIAVSVRAIRSTQDGAAAIAQARTLHQEAMARLVIARRSRPVSRQRCQLLVTMASELEFDIALIPEGLVFRNVSTSQGSMLSGLLSRFSDGPVLLMGNATRLKRALLEQSNVDSALWGMMGLSGLPEDRIHEVAGDESLVLIPVCAQR
ncbi:MAG: hypothetical protein ACI9KE_000702 [Polyangiales bacterium]|jgi:hypothetical protein